ncbi:MAG: flippase [Anaerolineae bacterium]|jgi:O-antigen/teichoic acid export membrane protein|nr:flippase [Chloroflexota bacterium]
MSEHNTESLDLGRLGRATGLTMARQLLAVGLAFMGSVLLSRILGPEAKGTYTVASVLALGIISVVNLGVGPATVYFVARGTYGTGRTIDNSIRLALMFTAIGVAGAALLIHYLAHALLPGVPVAFLYIGLVYIPASLFYSYSLSIVQGLEDYALFNTIGLAAEVATLSALIVLVWLLRRGVTGGLVALAVGPSVGVIVALWGLRHRRNDRPKLRLQCDPAYDRDVLSYGARTHLGNVAIFANGHAATLLVNYFLGQAAVGIYSLAAGLVERIAIVSSSAATVMLPRISSLQDADHLRNALTPLVTRHVVFFISLLALLAWVTASLIVGVVYGPAYSGATTVFQLLLPALLMTSVSRVLTSDIAGRGRPQVVTSFSLVQTVVNVVLNLALIPSHGILGAAVAASIGAGADTALKVAYYCRNYGVPWHEMVFMNRDDWSRLARFVSAQAARAKGRRQRSAPEASDQNGGTNHR